MAKIRIDCYGTKRYYNSNGQFHREDGPAIITPHGDKKWFTNGEMGSTSHPSEQDANGAVWWILDGVFQSPIRPTMDYPNGLKCWRNARMTIWPKLK